MAIPPKTAPRARPAQDNAADVESDIAPLPLPLNGVVDGLGEPEPVPPLDAPDEAAVLETVVPPGVLVTVTPKGVDEVVTGETVTEDPLLELEDVDEDDVDELEGGGAMLKSPV